MSGETEKQVSGWTVDTLKEKLEADIASLDRLMTQIDKDAKEGITLALQASDKRLDLLNEFRQQSADRDNNFLSKEVFDAFVQRFNEYKEAAEKSSNLNIGQKQGIDKSTKVIIASIGLVGTLLGIIVIAINLLTS